MHLPPLKLKKFKEMEMKLTSEKPCLRWESISWTTSDLVSDWTTCLWCYAYRAPETGHPKAFALPRPWGLSWPPQSQSQQSHGVHRSAALGQHRLYWVHQLRSAPRVEIWQVLRQTVCCSFLLRWCRTYNIQSQSCNMKQIRVNPGKTNNHKIKHKVAHVYIQYICSYKRSISCDCAVHNETSIQTVWTIKNTHPQISMLLLSYLKTNSGQTTCVYIIL